MDEDIAIVTDNVSLTIGPVTAADHDHYQTTGSWDFFEGHLIHDDDGTEIGMEETCREVYFAMRVRYCRRQLDKIEYFEDDHFVINYNFE